MSHLVYAQLNERNKGIRFVALINSGSTKTYAYENFNASDTYITGSNVSVTLPVFLSIARQDPNEMIFVNNSGASVVWGYYSTNKGSTFTSVGANNSFGLGTCISDTGSFMLVARGTTSPAVRYTYNAGSSWTSRTTGLVTNGTGVSCNGNGSKVFGSSTSLTSAWLTTNSFTSTTTVTLPFSSYSSCMPSDGSRIWIQKGGNTTPCQVAYSDNNGSSWTTVTVDANRASTQTVIRCSSNGVHLLLSSTGSYAHVSNDSGQNWTRVEFDGRLEQLAAAVSRSGKYMALSSQATNGKYYLSKNFGRTWQSKTISGVNQLLRGFDFQEV